MSLAIEKDSPVSPATIFWNNFIVVIRFTLSAGSLLWFFFLFQADEPDTKLMFLAVMMLWVGSFRASRDIEYGIILRRLRYNGVLVWNRVAPSEANPDPRWFCSAPAWGVSRKFADSLRQLGAEKFKALEPTDAYVQFAVGKSEDGEFILRKVHSCDNDPNGVCDKPQIHLFGYKEERDGRIWWGS